MPGLPNDLDSHVDRLWEVAAARVAAGGAGKLFNGRVFSADRFTPSLITGHMTEFRRIVAQMEQPELFPDLGVRPLAVCGVLRCADGIAIGRRPAAAIYQPGMWQLPPAGSVDGGALRPDDTIDLAGQVLTELTEELGVSASNVTAPLPICVVEHMDSHVSDLGMALVTDLDAAAVQRAHATHANNEYDPMKVVSFADLPSFIEEAGDLLVPPALIFLRKLGLLR
jgi:hypothetical protein